MHVNNAQKKRRAQQPLKMKPVDYMYIAQLHAIQTFYRQTIKYNTMYVIVTTHAGSVSITCIRSIYKYRIVQSKESLWAVSLDREFIKLKEN